MRSYTPGNFDAPGKQVKSPASLAHVVLRTNDLPRMRDYYVTFLGGRVVHENPVLCFITYDEEHHRIALIGMPDTSPKVRTSCGLEHIAFTFPTLADLCLTYKQRLANGIKPTWSVNHGPTTSIYYTDPDGNMIETQVDNFDTNEETNAFMSSEAFVENPIGVDFDPEELIEKIKRGESDAKLKQRPNIGPRGLPSAVV